MSYGFFLATFVPLFIVVCFALLKVNIGYCLHLLCVLAVGAFTYFYVGISDFSQVVLCSSLFVFICRLLHAASPFVVVSMFCVSLLCLLIFLVSCIFLYAWILAFFAHVCPCMLDLPVVAACLSLFAGCRPPPCFPLISLSLVTPWLSFSVHFFRL